MHNLLNDSITAAQVGVQCISDHLSSGLRQNLIFLRDNYIQHTNPPTPPPHVCRFDPTTLELAWDPAANKVVDNRAQSITVIGYNFTYAGRPNVELRDENDHRVALIDVTPIRQNLYMITIPLEAKDYADVKRPADRYAVTWKNAEPNEFGVQLNSIPAPQPIPTVSVVIHDVVLLNSEHTFGDVHLALFFKVQRPNGSPLFLGALPSWNNNGNTVREGASYSINKFTGVWPAGSVFIVEGYSAGGSNPLPDAMRHDNVQGTVYFPTDKPSFQGLQTQTSRNDKSNPGYRITFTIQPTQR